MFKRKKSLILILIFSSILIIFFIPFTNVSSNQEGAYQYCRYRFAVYEFYYIEAEGEGYGPSDIFLFNITLGKKIGGPLEYLGLKKITLKN